MAFCKQCGKEMTQGSAVCPHCGTAQGSTLAGTDRKANGGEIAIAILFPIIGAILYYVYKGDKPTAAKTINKISMLAFLAYFLIGILGGCSLTMLGAMV